MAGLDDSRRRERAAGLVLIAAAGAAIICANSSLEGSYNALLHLRFGPALPRFGVFDLDHWVSEALMAIFFLLVGLEVKREWYEGRLADPAERRMPIVAAIGGMVVPALIYLALVGSDPAHVQGWAIPAATDIAFAVAVLAILGRHAPSSIKLLLVAIAIVDDVGAVVIIALAYTADLDPLALTGAVAVVAGMATINLLGVRHLLPYLVGFALLWLLVLASGVHATIAGVVAALTIPLRDADGRSPLRKLEHAIHPWVMFAIVPLFGFTSAGVHLGGGGAALANPIALGVLLGLFLGKQLGIFGAIWASVRFGIAKRPSGAGWVQLWGASMLCGIGFTMSLFIGALAFPGDPEAIEAARLGTMAGSLLSAVAGFALLRLATNAGVDEDESDASALFAGDEA